MDLTSDRSLLVSEIKAYVTIIHERGLDVDLPSDSDLAVLPLTDLRQILSRVRQLARTPTS